MAMHTRRHRTIAVVVAASAVVGCTSGTAPDDDPSPTTPASTSDQPSEPAPSEPPPSEPSPSEAEATGSSLAGTSFDLDLQQRTENSTLMRLTRLEITDDQALLDVEIVIPADLAFAQFNNSQQNPGRMTDDLGNEYSLISPDGNVSIGVDEGQVLEGTLAYDGPIADDATTLTVTFNPNSDTTQDSVRDRIQPFFEFGPISLEDGSVEGETGGGEIATVEVDLDLEQESLNGSVARVSRLEVTDLEVLVDVVITPNPDAAFSMFNNRQFNPMLLVDDLGNEYVLVPPEDNPNLLLDDGEELDGTLVFQGPVRPGASELTLFINRNSDDGEENSSDRQMPAFTFGPVDITP